MTYDEAYQAISVAQHLYVHVEGGGVIEVTPTAVGEFVRECQSRRSSRLDPLTISTSPPGCLTRLVYLASPATGAQEITD